MPLKEALDLGRRWLLSPRSAIDGIRAEPKPFAPAFTLYTLILLASALFHSWKPAGFPPIAGEYDLGLGPERGLPFWLSVQAYNPLLTALWLLLLSAQAELLRGRRLALRLFASAAFVLSLLLPIALYANRLLPKPLFAALEAGLLAAHWPLVRSRPRGQWAELLLVLCGLGVVNLALTPLLAAAVLLESAAFYHSLEIAALFWVLGLGSFAVARVEQLPTPRAFAALFLSLLAQMFAVFALYFLGAVPKDILKALMTI